MRRPQQRPKLPLRKSDNEKRRLQPQPDHALIAELVRMAIYNGSSKHKENPHLYGLAPYNGLRGDETMCDRDANFGPEHIARANALLRRGIRAGLLGVGMNQGVPTMVWTVADDGWIYEARITNPAQANYHGYPVRGSEAIAQIVYERFSAWARSYGDATEKLAANACNTLYGFRS